MDNIFKKINFHELNVKENSDLICVYNAKIYKNLLKNIVVLKKNNLEKLKLREYDFFANITVEEIDILRKLISNKKPPSKTWCIKILRYLEIRKFILHKNLNSKYDNGFDKMIFIQKIITLLLEYSFLNKDSRFLNIALKLLKEKKLNIFKENSKPGVYHSYNLLFSYYLLNNFNNVF